MKEQELLALAQGLGFCSTAVVNTADIVFEPAFRPFCEENLCGWYGANYACPPDCGTVEEMRQRVLCYRRGLVLQSRWEIGEVMDEEQIRSAKDAHNRWTRKVMERAGGEGLMVGAGGCDLCDPCLRTQGKPCRFPQLRFSCMSAYCMDVARLAKTCGMPYYEHGIAHFFSMCCFMEDKI